MWSEPTQPLAPAAIAPETPARPSRRWPLVLLFCLLAGLIPETLATTSTSVAKIIANPGSLLFVALFYGTADLVIREAIIRRPLGLTGKLLLGIAFGFVNEGVVAATWYTVRPQGYSFIGGVDWDWAVSLTVFHTFVSVLMPIYLFESVAPSVAGQPLLRRRGIIIASALFLGLSLAFALTPQYRAYRLAVFAVALLLTWIALSLPPAHTGAPADAVMKAAPGLWRLRALGFVAMLLYFVCIYFLPALFATIGRRVGAPSALAGLLANAPLVALAVWATALCVGWTRRAWWSPRRQLALITGALAFTALVTALPQLGSTYEPLVTIPFMLYLIILAWRARRAERRAAIASAASLGAV
jgi:hypothetical protein